MLYSFNMLDGASAFVTHKGKLLLILRDFNTTNQPNTWCLPGGGAEVGETAEEVLKRELQEEISFTPTNYRLLFKRRDKEVLVYHVPLSDEDVSKLKLGDEGQKMEFFSLKELQNLALMQNLKLYITDPEYKKYLEEII